MIFPYAACAPQVAPETIVAIIQVESQGKRYAIGVNGGPPVPPAKDAAEAAKLAHVAIAHSRSVDLGYMQVNSRNLASLGYTVEQMFDPCTNIHAGAIILAADYAAAVAQQGEGQAALRTALSLYNTGDYERGFANGYVAKYYGPVRVPRLIGRLPQKPNPYTADIEVYARKDASKDAPPEEATKQEQTKKPASAGTDK